MALTTIDPGAGVRSTVAALGLPRWERAWILACVEAYHLRAAAVVDGPHLFPFISIRGTQTCLPFTHHARDIGTLRNAHIEEIRAAASTGAVEIRAPHPLDADMPYHTAYDHFVLDLRDELWGRLGSRRRGKIRHATHSGVELRQGLDELSAFYRLYSAAITRMGTPPHAKAFLGGLAEALKEDALVVVAYAQTRPVAGAFLTRRNGRYVLEWSVCLQAYKRHYLSDMLVWRCAEAARESGGDSLDLGRAKRDTGLHRYKSSWPCRVAPLYYYSTDPRGHLRYQSRRARVASRLWRRLPVWFARAVGPRLRRSLP